MDNTQQKYMFVWKDSGWWLRITTLNELFNYWDKTDYKWHRTFENLIHSKEFTKNGMQHADATSYAVGMYARKNNLPLLNAVAEFAGEVKGQQLDYLLKYKQLFFNQNGGYHFAYEKNTSFEQFCYRDRLVFPDYKKNEIRIKSFPGGTHYYAYIGDVQVRNGDILKWDTYQEAYEYALVYVTNTKEDYENEQDY